MPAKPTEYRTRIADGWPWVGTMCALHGVLTFMVAYGPRFLSIADRLLPAATSSLAICLHWLWLGWPITGAWRGTRYAIGAVIPFGIGLTAWLASCYAMVFYTLLQFMHT